MAADGCLPVSEPRIVDAARTAWSHECDVLVAGFGAAGVATAIGAQEQGARALICERFTGGGATAASGGIIYAGGGTPYQRSAGYEDTPEAMFRYLSREVGEAVSEPTLRRFCTESRALIEWLEELGVRFASDPQPPKTSYPRDGVYLYFSGNESVPENAAVAAPAPRGHRVVGKGQSGRALFAALRAAIRARDIPVMRQTAMRRLLMDHDGRVIGAELARLAPGAAAARRHHRLMRWAERLHYTIPKLADALRRRALRIEQAQSEILTVRARGGVVLTSGGFIFNRAMVAEHAPAYLETLRLGATGCDGSGIRLGMSAGGAVDRLDRVSAWRFINPPQAFPSGMVVDRRGERFCNEEVYGATLGVRMCEEHEGRAWLIVDRALRRSALRESVFGGLWSFQRIPALLLLMQARRARSLEALAGKIGVDGERLVAAVGAMNAAIAERRPDPLGKSDAVRRPLTQPPFHALDISAGNPLSPCPAITLGGLRVEEASGGVLDESGRRIPGLYAAGRAAVGVASNGYVSGLSLADCFWAGRRAGAAAALARGDRAAAPEGGASSQTPHTAPGDDHPAPFSIAEDNEEKHG